MEPITLTFAACKLAYEGIKTAVEVYKDVKNTGGEVAGIANEVGGLLSKFFHGQDLIEDEHKKKQEETRELAKQGKVKNVTLQAIDNVIHVREVRQYYKDLEHMVRYELGMPDLWTEIQEERDRLVKEAQEIERLHVVQAVGELDDDDPDVLRGGQQHPPPVLRLGVVVGGELQVVELGHPRDELGDLVAELRAQLLRRRRRVGRRQCPGRWSAHVRFGAPFRACRRRRSPARRAWSSRCRLRRHRGTTPRKRRSQC